MAVLSKISQPWDKAILNLLGNNKKKVSPNIFISKKTSGSWNCCNWICIVFIQKNEKQPIKETEEKIKNPNRR